MKLVALLVAVALAPRVSARGCFAPHTLVTLWDGSRRAIANVSVGDVVRAWDDSAGRRVAANVLVVTRVWSDELMDVLLEDGATRITSTPDHPYWSHAKGRIVSANPEATQKDYGLETSLIGDNETFADEEGRPLRGAVLRRQGPPELARKLRGGGRYEVFTLCLDQHHWFFVHGVRVHNKGCFVPETLVTLGTGARVPMSSVSEGDRVLSWDPERQEAANATVKVVKRALADELVDVVLGEGAERITSTPDHPYWSHGKQRIVSRDHLATQDDYGLHVEAMDDNETLVGERGQPIRAAVVRRVGTGARSLLALSGRGATQKREVITFCLDRFHWYFVHGVRVHNKGCFVPSTLVTLGDGSRKPLSRIVKGDTVRSWDEEHEAAANATVMSVMRYQSSGNLVDVLLHDGATRITSTPDHPFWSHGQRRIVSRDPNATKEDYDLPAGMMGDMEVFADEEGRPLPGRVQGSSATRSLRKLAPALAQEVITLCLDRYHWFFAHGARVHNKGFGCFVAETPVTLSDGSRRAIAGIREGDVVRSWDEERRKASTATVVSVMRYRSSDLMDVSLGNGTARITSTPDHPYWSHSQRSIVSRYPEVTSEDYKLRTAMMGDAETFEDEAGQPVQGLVQHRNASGAMTVRRLRDAPAVGVEVITFCLDRHHWFFVQGVRVHNKGCFVASTPVTLGDGRLKAIGTISKGDVVLSWDEASRRAINATVASVVRARSVALADVFVHGGSVRITSTPDHPYWSERQQRIVSLDPDATSRDYGLAAGAAQSEEVFADAAGQPVSGSVSRRTVAARSLASWEGDRDPHCLRGEECEVVTLTLETSHWFFVHGIRVHNKGGGDDGNYCCCAPGFKWNPVTRKCEPCPGDGLRNGGQECFGKCGGRSGACPSFCGAKGKCCRSEWHEPGASTGPDGCSEYEGGTDRHVCVGSADKNVSHPLGDCWLVCGQRGGKCDWCGDNGFCCRLNTSMPGDLIGESGCRPGEGDPTKHICVNRGSLSCDTYDLVPESRNWAWCDNFPQSRCDYKEVNWYCCCDKGYQWDNATQQCTRCMGTLEWVTGGYLQGTAADRCQGSAVVKSTLRDGECHPSLHMHECPGTASFSVWTDLLGVSVLIICCACVALCYIGCCALIGRLPNQQDIDRARACKFARHPLRGTTCQARADQGDRSYLEGWYCDMCNRFTSFGSAPFGRCYTCNVDFCATCQPLAAPAEVQMSLANQSAAFLAGGTRNWAGMGGQSQQYQPLDNS